jgi:aspartate/methionine/tyrosine aminotransferase
MEFYNRKSKPEFDRMCETLENAKMIEVSSTKLPQLAIPLIMQDDRYLDYIKTQSEKIGKRSKIITDILAPVQGIKFNETFGAFYNTIIFEEGVLNYKQSLKIENLAIKKLVESWVEEEVLNFDQRFVYYLLGAKGVCVVPISSFCSDLLGFRVTLLEENEKLLLKIFNHIKEGLIEYLNS